MTTAALPDLMQAAHRHSVQEKVPVIAEWLQQQFGQKLTARMAGIGTPKLVGAWARGEQAPHPKTETQLRYAYRVAWLLSQVDDRDTVRAWFVGMNPQLDERSPGELIGEEPDRVLKAAQAFAAGG